jgi:hypothetical protein
MSRLVKAGVVLPAGALACALLAAGGARAQTGSTQAQPPPKPGAGQVDVPKQGEQAAPSGSQAQPPPKPGLGQVPAPQQGDQAKKDPKAMSELKDMSTKLASAKTLRFKSRGLRPLRLDDGDWVTLVTNASVMRDGKDKLYVEWRGDAYPFNLIFDGQTVTAFAPKSNAYAQKSAPGTIDQALEKSEKRGEIHMAFADLLGSDPYKSMTKGLLAARVVGTSTLGGTEVQHLAAHGQQLDWEIWIGSQDHLPRMITLTDVSEARKPTYTLEFFDWSLDQTLPTGTFTFVAPPDAKKIPFRSPEEESMKEQQRGSGGD